MSEEERRKVDDEDDGEEEEVDWNLRTNERVARAHDEHLRRLRILVVKFHIFLFSLLLFPAH